MMSLRGRQPEAIPCYMEYILSRGDCFDGRAPSRNDMPRVIELLCRVCAVSIKTIPYRAHVKIVKEMPE